MNRLTVSFFLIAHVGTPLVMIALTLGRPERIARKPAWTRAAVALAGWFIITLVINAFFLFSFMAHGVDEKGNYGPIDLPDALFRIFLLGYALLCAIFTFLLWKSFRSA